MRKSPAKLRVVDNTPKRSLAPRELALLTEMYEAFHAHQAGSNRYQERGVLENLKRVDEFLAFAKAPPWRCTPEDFDKWCLKELVEKRNIAPSSQAKYCAAIREFFGYVRANDRFRNVLRREFDVEMPALADRDACITSAETGGRTMDSLLRFTPKERELFFSTFDKAIHEVLSRPGPLNKKVYYALARDNTLFRFMDASAGRRMEPCRVDVDSFAPDKHFPSLGAFACVTLQGKGSKGQGPKLATIPLAEPGLAEVLEHYIRVVRPFYLKAGKANEKAMFLSERGIRLHPSSVGQRFHAACRRAGLATRGTHSLRRGKISDLQQDGVSPETARRFARHEFQSTTQGYTLLGDEFSAQEMAKWLAAKEALLSKGKAS